ncbi:hypothetical protein [uncultured Clostridium sp.]|uniref:hypothetical protein n=1 Tax=uncultured Clostridium sp. TaxID=59620 RepID=UPI0028E480D2|nr:hypothetical protein [uncultured Clostridium sp.]
MLRERQKNEAIKRMKKLNLHENVLNEFEKENKLNISRAGGVLFNLIDKEIKMVNEFEDESGNLVYHVIYNKKDFMELYTFFYISKNEEEWDLDMEDLDNNIVVTYVLNVTNKLLSEYGDIKFKKSLGGLIRTS